MAHLAKLMLFVVVVFVAACTERGAEVPPPQVSAPNETERAKAEKAADERREKAAREAEDTQRQEDIRRIRVILGLESEQSEWNPILTDVKSGKLSLFGKVCKDLQRYEDLSWVVWQLKNDPSITEFNPAQVKAASVEAGTEAAKGLIEILKQPFAVRAEVGSCHRGEGSYIYGESYRIVEDMTLILHEIGLKLEDVKTSRQAIRDILLKDFRARIVEMRARIKRGEASSSDGGGMLIGIAVDAIGWGFSPEELQLTKEETATAISLAKHRG